jgi:dienelactone hydrolase
MKVFFLSILSLFLVACAKPMPSTTPTPSVTPTPLPIPVPLPDVTEYVYFQSLTLPGNLWSPFMPPPEDGIEVNIRGLLKIPESSGQIPAVILTHGCGGMGSGEVAWETRLNEMGIATFSVYSLGSRNIFEMCSGNAQINIASVLVDAYRALDVLAEHPRIDASRIAILGRSFGGRTALWVSHTRFQERYATSENQFAAHLAFYPPSCYMQLADETAVSGKPMRIFHGSKDNWTPIDQCKAYIGRLQQAGVDIALYEYPDAFHSFDDPNSIFTEVPNALTPGNCNFVEQDGQIIDPETGQEPTVNSACVKKGVVVGHNAEAERQAVADVEAFLTGVFGLK